MIVFIYFIFLFMTGFSLANLINKDSKFQSLALAPALGILIPSLIVYFYNSVGILINKTNLLVSWIPISIILIFLSHKAIQNLFLDLIIFYKSQNKKYKFLLAFIFITFISFIVRAQTRVQWGNDAKRVWVGKPLEWISYEKIFLSSESVDSLHIWSGYPMLHSIGIMVNTLVLPLKVSYVTNITDYYYMIGLAFTFSYLYSLLKFSNIQIVVSSVLSLFIQRRLVIFNGASMAEFNFAYEYLLGFILLWEAYRYKKLSNYFLAGIVLAMMAITKDEGLYRIFFLLSILQLFSWRKILKVREYLAVLAPILIFWCMNEYNMYPQSSFNDWYNGATRSIYTVIGNIPFMLESLYFSIKPTGALKASWLLIILLATLSYFEHLKSRKDLMPLINTMVLIFALNAIFNVLPLLVITPGSFSYRASAEFQGYNIINRLNLHSISFLTAVGFMGMINFKWYKLKKKIT